MEVGFSQTPVLIRVVRAEQHDTLGCNIVSEITSLVYKQVINGKVKLWDSREKEIQITGTTLVEIERSSKTSFTDQEIIYIYEYWTGSGKSLKSETSGFSFSSKSKTGEEVSFGYVDFRDIQDLIFGTTVKSNANGNFNTTLAFYLNGKNYYYHIIQYGGTVIENITKSEQIKSDLTGGTGHFSNTAASSVEIPQKIVSWLLDINDNSDSEKYINSRKFEKAVQDYLSSNREIYYNLGGDKISTHINVKSKLSITRIQVKEIWKKIDEKIQLPEGYRIEYGGQFEAEAEASKTLLATSLLSLLVIFLLLFQEFKDLKTASIILLNLPLALIGAQCPRRVHL